MSDVQAHEAPKTVNVTYLPKENGDPHQVKFAGILFRAHLPTPVPINAMMETLGSEKIEMQHGAIGIKYTETRRKVLDALVANPYFLVDGHEQAQKGRGRPRLPSNADEYRGHALRWIGAVETLAELQQRWKAEAKLRDDCGCTEVDLAQVSPFLYARLEGLGGTGLG